MIEELEQIEELISKNDEQRKELRKRATQVATAALVELVKKYDFRWKGGYHMDVQGATIRLWTRLNDRIQHLRDQLRLTDLENYVSVYGEPWRVTHHHGDEISDDLTIEGPFADMVPIVGGYPQVLERAIGSH
jgi:hypothetical protein